MKPLPENQTVQHTTPGPAEDGHRPGAAPRALGHDTHNTDARGLPRQLLKFKASGLQFIGDPHMTCVRPGRRLEDDFLSVVLDKIQQAREIAEERDLLMVFLGDLVDNPTARRAGTAKVVENTNQILAGFARAMAFRPCIAIPGNHDKEEVRLTEGTTLQTMRDLGLVHVIEPGGPYAVIEIGDVRVGLGGTPYGDPIPEDVRGAFEALGEPVDKVIWITHDQFEFDLPNPYLKKVFEIRGCDMVVNGHDHTNFKPRQVGQTWWHNPGNITRMTVDCANHDESVWEWHPNMPCSQMKQHVLRHEKNVFDLRGMQVQADVQAAQNTQVERARSLFSELLAADSAAEMDRSESGDLLAQDIMDYIADNPGMSEGAKAMLLNLHARAPERLKP